MKCYNMYHSYSWAHPSLPARGAWIEICGDCAIDQNVRLSLPARGAWIEILNLAIVAVLFLSLPARGAWIEISNKYIVPRSCCCRSPHGERGLKLDFVALDCETTGSRSPHGERGLKSPYPISSANSSSRRSPHGERGLKCEMMKEPSKLYSASLPARGAWIEIFIAESCQFIEEPVAPRTGSVD